MYRGSMAQMAEIKDGLWINKESLQPRPWPAFPLPVPKTESIARDIALQFLRDGREDYRNV
jgi:hypothetical protein